jgi:hypothetical protein
MVVSFTKSLIPRDSMVVKKKNNSGEKEMIERDEMIFTFYNVENQ